MRDTDRGQLAAYGAVLMAIGVAVWLLLAGGGGGGGSGKPVAAVGVDGPGADGPSADRRRGPKPRIYVHVAGAVRRPGLYGVPAGSRVAVAVRRAGGATRGADPVGLNLALRLQDGQQVVVPRRGQPAMAAGGGGPAGAAAPGGLGGPGRPLQLSTATVEQLDQLDGIGPTLAKRIIEYREKHGGFRSVEQLREVEGIGPKRFADLRKAVRP